MSTLRLPWSEAQFDTIIPILSSLIKMKWEHRFRKHKVESIRSNIGYILMKLELQAKQVAPFILSLAKKEQHSNTRYFETLINICAAIGADNKKVTSFLAHIIGPDSGRKRSLYTICSIHEEPMQTIAIQCDRKCHKVRSIRE